MNLKICTFGRAYARLTRGRLLRQLNPKPKTHPLKNLKQKKNIEGYFSSETVKDEEGVPRSPCILKRPPLTHRIHTFDIKYSSLTYVEELRTMFIYSRHEFLLTVVEMNATTVTYK